MGREISEGLGERLKLTEEEAARGVRALHDLDEGRLSRGGEIKADRKQVNTNFRDIHPRLRHSVFRGEGGAGSVL